MNHDTTDKEQNDTPESTFPAGSIGGLSIRVGYDVRDLYMEGYSWKEIHDVAYGRLTLEELRERGPRRKRP